ncbi:hypothetical protein [Helicobacter sp. 11S03491-1]|uniref:hypothetical protein n=1 Tax=Helicobacter sp. 11S03491-1 TaxID=1476196 RepID=UPI000BA78F11|nr:hypothetical protein [Helicobacter sp. 11S03491-1]PAF41574.1 hypothetical protein BKH45_06645 [Helicobacter sp. 11S03491-1]
MKKILFCLMLLLPVFIFADSWRDLNELHQELKEVGLNDDQEKAVKSLFKQYHHELKQWWKNNGKTDALVMKIFSENELDIDQIRYKLKSIHRKKIEIDLRFLKDLHSILTKEQRDKIANEFGEDD